MGRRKTHITSHFKAGARGAARSPIAAPIGCTIVFPRRVRRCLELFRPAERDAVVDLGA